MNPFPSHPGTAFPAIGLLVACIVFSPAATAQEATGNAAAPMAAPDSSKAAETQAQPSQPTGLTGAIEPEYAPLQVGDATQTLLAWQSSGVIASPTPRPISGAIAYRSYERYLKSFEFPIPEHLNSSVKTQSGASK